MARISEYRQAGRTLTTSFVVTSTTINTKETKIRGDDTVRISVDEKIVEQEFSVRLDIEFELPSDCVTKLLCITSAHKFKLFYRASPSLEYNLFAICDRHFLFNGAIVGQFKIVGDYDIATHAKVIYA